ncbi:alpha/beta-hydrolase [Lepidopterella palustris CBS 459.81]|uniref:Alpha/beta-hydrolase n=1 Tax=Lepidopterella palustris CBS 459.81 TaxID=1314670 RepID=A0A8E2E3E3_9PEZI|nr:alpha/beta-hydrolase [Lepidopterella palustris CBS 459.81]
MILGQISYIDCIVFVIFLAPQLLIHVGLWQTSRWLLGALPFLALKLPFQFLNERYFTRFYDRSPFVQRATAFQDFVIRCVRYAFAFMPAYIGRVFFSKAVALPFFRFRMLRHGFVRSPISWHEVNRTGLQGLWITFDQSKTPDIVVYYGHGGGFSMGSVYFYMEFFLAWVALLKDVGYQNPALFALEYTLVPDAVYPTQVQQAFAGYEYALSIARDSSRVCVGGDSAGATLILSLLLYISGHPEYRDRLPGMATMISPWVTLVSAKYRNTPSDYLNLNSLHRYGRQYCGTKAPGNDPLVSPGNCRDINRWTKASPTNGWVFLFGSEEVLGPETRDFIALLRKAGAEVEVYEEQGGIHAWPVASLYLGETKDERLKGLRNIVSAIRRQLD